MSSKIVSSLNVNGDSLVPGGTPVPVDPFVPGSANLFPKMVERINDAAWELWQFDALSADGETAVTVSFYRDTRGLQEGGFHAELNGLWPDGSKWGQKLYFPESIITAEGGDDSPHNSGVKGVWKSPNDGAASATFTIAADLSTATVYFDVPDRVTGTFELHALSDDLKNRLPATESAALLGPSVYYLFPLGPAAVTVDLTFTVTAEEAANETKTLVFRPDDGARGGFVRGWSASAWPQIMSDAYYLCGTAGPYMLQMIRIVSSAADGRKPHVVARLYRDKQLVCATNQLADSTESLTDGIAHEDTVFVERLLDGAGEKWLAGAFRDRNTGYAIEFIQGNAQQEKKRWRFEARHRRAWWSDYTSDQGTGKSGFLEKLFGGAAGETFEGAAGAGQLQLP